MPGRMQGRSVVGSQWRRLFGCSVALSALTAGAVHSPANGASAPNTWTAAKPLDKCAPASRSCAGRRDHDATLLKNGKVLIVGGQWSRDTSQTFDPATGSWAPTGPMIQPTLYANATTLPNGKVLVIGEGGPQLYDPAKGAWASVPPAPAGTHFQATVTVMATGKVLVAGGLGSEIAASAAVDIYDPATNTWQPTAPLTEIRTEHAASLLPSGKVLVVGGATEYDGPPTRKTAEVYDPVKRSWSLTGEVAAGVVGHTVTLLADGKVLLAGGQGEESRAPVPGARAAQVYDEATGNWSRIDEMKSGRTKHTATLLPDGTVLVVGGNTAVAGRGDDRPEDLVGAEVYDPAAGTWAPAAPPGYVRSGHTATLLRAGPASGCAQNCGKVLVVGGHGLPDRIMETVMSAELYEAALPASVSPAASSGRRPARDAAPPDSAPSPSSGSENASAKSRDESSSLPIVMVVAGVLAVAGTAGFLLMRRRREPKA